MIQTTTLTAQTTPTTALPAKIESQPVQRQLNGDVRQDSVPKLTFDPEALAQKYREEREKRLRYTEQRGGVDQYRSVEADSQFSRFLNDPYVSERLERAPIKEDCEALVVGGGYGAQLIAIELLKRGIKDIKIVEKGGDFGGTWYWNRYPGAQCDIESYVYMPLLEETNYVPTRKYAGGRELLHHAQAIGRQFDLYSKAHFQTEVKTLRWDEERARWSVETDRGDVFSSRFVIPSAGPLHRPKLPGLPGLGSFKGHSFHTSRWDYSYTGGDPIDDPESLTGLADKRVGVIGTGATAVQIVPHLGRCSKHLYVFQRTPSSIDYRGNKDTDPDWVKTLGEHWQKRRMDNFNIIVNGGPQDEDLVSDGWTDILRKLTVRNTTSSANDADPGPPPAAAAEKRQLVDFEKMEQIRHRCDEVVRDPRTAESLKPYYNQFCKRPCFHDDYLPTFNRPNVTLVDTEGKGVEAITEKGVVANGTEIELDCIVFATGFDTAGSWLTKTGMAVYGREGASLADRWRHGPATLHGHSARDFPNMFIVSNMQAGLSPNYLHMTGFQAEHVAYIIDQCHARRARTTEPTQAAQDAWVRAILDAGKGRKASRLQCTPGYYNNEGESSDALQIRGSYGGGALEFMKMMREWRAAGDLPGLELKPWPEAESVEP